MYRQLLMFPTSASAETVDAIAGQMASVLRKQAGFQSMTTSVGPLMGPSAQDGRFGSVVEVVFDSLETSMAAIDAEEFAEVAAQAEALDGDILLFEFQAR